METYPVRPHGYVQHDDYAYVAEPPPHYGYITPDVHMPLPPLELKTHPVYENLRYENVSPASPEHMLYGRSPICPPPQHVYTPAPRSTENETGQESAEERQVGQGTELLSLRPTPSFDHRPLMDEKDVPQTLSIDAHLHGMFFMAEPSSPPVAQTFENSQFPELTCYRRNLFQLTGSVRTPRKFPHVVTVSGERLRIVSQELQVSASESVDHNPVKLITVPYKTLPEGMELPAQEDKNEKEPSEIGLDIPDGDSDYVDIPFAWKRLQFRIATANNGRRRELQQHFVVRLTIIATLSNGTRIPITETRSGSVVVRGRSPRNFISKNEQPISNDRNANRRGIQTAASVKRSPKLDTKLGLQKSPVEPSPLKRKRSEEPSARAVPRARTTVVTEIPPTRPDGWSQPVSSGNSSASTLPTPGMTMSSYSPESQTPPSTISPSSAHPGLVLAEDPHRDAHCLPSSGRYYKPQRPSMSATWDHPSCGPPTLPSTSPAAPYLPSQYAPPPSIPVGYRSLEVPPTDYYTYGPNRAGIWRPPPDTYYRAHSHPPMQTSPAYGPLAPIHSASSTPGPGHPQALGPLQPMGGAESYSDSPTPEVLSSH